MPQLLKAESGFLQLADLQDEPLDIGSCIADSGFAAAIDLGKGTLVSSTPIEIHTDQGSIRANALNVSERGKHVIFSNGVSVTFLPPGDLAAASKAPSAIPKRSMG